jgi:hypothetical protein
MIFVGDYAPGELLTEIDLQTDFLVMNLEGPIANGTLTAQTKKNFQTKKVGPILYSSNWPDYSGQIIYTLANNHFMDLGNELARQNTYEIQESNNLHTGHSSIPREDDDRILRFKYKGLMLGILSVTENQHGIATADTEGVNGLGNWIFPAIEAVRETVDYLIVASHAGAEDSPVPLPYFQNLYREFVNCGADLVVGHHSHIPQGFEKFQNGYIFYGLGNFAVDPSRWRSSIEPNLNLISLAVELDFKKGRPSIQAYPLIQSFDNEGKYKIRRADHDHRVARYIELCNMFVVDAALRDDFWRYFASFLFKIHSGPMLSEFSKIQPHSWIRNLIHRLLCGEQDEPTFRELANIRSKHILECESHIEVAKIALSQPDYYRKKPRASENDLVKEIISFLPNHN